MEKYIVKVGKMYVSDANLQDGQNHWTTIDLTANEKYAKEYSDFGYARKIKDELGGAIYEKNIVESLVLVEDVTAHEHVFETESVFENVRKIQKVEENSRLRGTPTTEI